MMAIETEEKATVAIIEEEEKEDGKEEEDFSEIRKWKVLRNRSRRNTPVPGEIGIPAFSSFTLGSSFDLSCSPLSSSPPCPSSPPDPSKRKWKLAYDAGLGRSRNSSLALEGPPPNIISININHSNVEIHEYLGGGGSGAQVFMASADGFHFAAKILKTENVESVIEAVKTEIQIMESLDHENIVKYLGHDFGKSEIRLYMSYYSSTLNQVLKERKKDKSNFSEKMIINYSLQLAKGLNYLHSLPLPILHRDLKAENVFVTFDSSRNISKLRIGDFDTSKILEVSNEKAFTRIGTEGFMAPEVMAHPVKGYTSQADVWSLGMVLFEMMVLDKPYFDIPKVNRQIAIEKGQRPSLPAEIESKYPQLVPIWKLCTKKDPAKRLTAEKLIKKLREIV